MASALAWFNIYIYIYLKFTVPYKMKSQNYHTVGIVPNSNRRLVERGKNDTLIYKYMTAHLPGLIQVP